MTWLGLICRQLLVLEGEVCTLLPRGTFPASWAVRETQNLILYVSEVRPLILVSKTGLPPLGPLPAPPPPIPSCLFCHYTSLSCIICTSPFFPFSHSHILSLPCSCPWHLWSLLTVPLGALSLSSEDAGQIAFWAAGSKMPA